MEKTEKNLLQVVYVVTCYQNIVGIYANRDDAFTCQGDLISKIVLLMFFAVPSSILLTLNNCVMSEQSKQEVIASAESLVPFFSIDLTISIFGHVIFQWHFPPKKS